MLLNIYLGTTVISWACTFIYSAILGKRLEKDGYKLVKQEKSFIKKLLGYLSVLFKASIPVYNILNTIVMICLGDKFYEIAEYTALQRGEIYLAEDEASNIEPDMESPTVEEEKSNSDIIPKTSEEKKYEDMSIEEKIVYLDRKRALLLIQQTNEENSYENMSIAKRLAYIERKIELLLSQKASMGNENLSDDLDQQGPVRKRSFDPRRFDHR